MSQQECLALWKASDIMAKSKDKVVVRKTMIKRDKAKNFPGEAVAVVDYDCTLRDYATVVFRDAFRIGKVSESPEGLPKEDLPIFWLIRFVNVKFADGQRATRRRLEAGNVTNGVKQEFHNTCSQEEFLERRRIFDDEGEDAADEYIRAWKFGSMPVDENE